MPEHEKRRLPPEPTRQPQAPKSEEIWDMIRALVRSGDRVEDYEDYRLALSVLCPEHITPDELQEMCADYAQLRVRP